MKLSPIFTLAVISIAASVVIGCANTSRDMSPDEQQAQRAKARAEFQNLIATQIDDPVRAKTFTNLSAERDQLISEHKALVQQYSKRLTALSLDYSTERQDLEVLIQEYNVERRAAQTGFLALMGEMKATVTAKEWKKLAKFEQKELGPRTLSRAAGGQ